MIKWKIINHTTEEIWEQSARFRIPLGAFQSLKSFIRNGLRDMWIDAGDQLQGIILTHDDKEITKTPLMDAAYFPSYSWTNITTIMPYSGSQRIEDVGG